MDDIVSLPFSIEEDGTQDGRPQTPRPHTRASVLSDSIVPEQGYLYTIASFFYMRIHSVVQSFREGFFGMIKSFFMCITLPCYVCARPLVDGRSGRTKISHPGIIYFYILLSCTIVFNLWEQQAKADTQMSTSYQILQYFEALSMVLAVVGMLYIARATRGRVDFRKHEKNMTFYFRTGIYVFGISSLLYTTCRLVNYSNCGDVQNIIVNSAKFLFVIGQILFLNRFYQAKLPNDRPFIQIALAQVLGTNLSLWIWTVCKEVYDAPLPNHKKDCDEFPIHLAKTERYFYPLFVEYLLLVASMMYELWANIQVTDASKSCNSRQGCFYKRYYEQLEREESGGEDVEEVVSRKNRRVAAERRRRKFAPSLAVSLVLGLILASVFIAFVLASSDSGKNYHSQFFAFLIVNICLYCSQIVACYIAMVCCQSQQTNDADRHSVDLDDALLYLGLAGILLWEGFHLYGLIFAEKRKIIEFINSGIGILDDIVQTIALVSARRCRSRYDGNARTITSCALFLLATNFAFWCENSFYIEQELQNPGEDHESIEDKLNVFANILNPLIIFFRFHSATCCYLVWVIFDQDDPDA